MSEVEREMTLLSGQCRNHDEKLRELAAVLQHLQARVDQMDGDSEETLSLVQRVVGQHLKEIGADRLSGSQVMLRGSQVFAFCLGMNRRGAAVTSGCAFWLLGAVC